MQTVSPLDRERISGIVLIFICTYLYGQQWKIKASVDNAFLISSLATALHTWLDRSSATWLFCAWKLDILTFLVQ